MLHDAQHTTKQTCTSSDVQADVLQAKTQAFMHTALSLIKYAFKMLENL